ncbi:MAG: site-specific integrase [Opitutaceae bacterium]
MTAIRVSVVAPGPDRPNYRLRYRDPATGEQHWKSSKTADRRDAEREAARWELELSTGGKATTSKISWAAFRQRFEQEALPGLADKTAANYRTTMNLLETLCRPKRLASVDSGMLSRFAERLRVRPVTRDKEPLPPRSENSVKTYLNQIAAILGWACRVGLLGSVPRVPKIKRTRAADSPMKGRPLTEPEFQTILANVEAVVGPLAAPSWRFWLTGLWWSGLRLEESLALSWDATGGLSVDLSGKYPMLRVKRHWEKGHKDRILPIAPEFAEFLLAVPINQRSGLVFRLQAIECPTAKGGRSRAMPGTIDSEWAGRIVSRIGKAAGVVVDTSDAGRIKYATAHDLRRSFGSRWALRVMPPVLKELMRHDDIKTTMKYYVGYNADRTAEAAWAAIRPQGGEAANGSVRGSAGSENTKKASQQEHTTTSEEST